MVPIALHADFSRSRAGGMLLRTSRCVPRRVGASPMLRLDARPLRPGPPAACTGNGPATRAVVPSPFPRGLARVPN